MEKKKVFKKVLKIVLIIVILLILILTIHIIRNYIIIRKLQNKISQYKDITNYNIKVVSKNEDGMTTIMDYYIKDDKQVVFMEKTINNETTKISRYDNGQTTDLFVDTKDSKIANLDAGSMVRLEVVNQLETNNNWQTLLGCINTNVKSVNYNEEKCYKITKFISLTSSTYKGAEIYIDKETGLLVKSVSNDSISDRKYEFENVQDDIFIEPDIGQYTLKEN